MPHRIRGRAQLAVVPLCFPPEAMHHRHRSQWAGAKAGSLAKAPRTQGGVSRALEARSQGPERPCALRGISCQKVLALRTQRVGRANAGRTWHQVSSDLCSASAHQPSPQDTPHANPRTLSSITATPTAVFTYTYNSSHGCMHTTLVHRQTQGHTARTNADTLFLNCHTLSLTQPKALVHSSSTPLSSVLNCASRQLTRPLPD